MVKERGMVKGVGEGKGDGQGGWSREGVEKRKGMVKGRAYLGPRRCLCACVPVVSSLGHVASSSSRVAWSCRRWAVSPPRRRCMSGHVVVVACPRWRRCAVLVVSLCGVVVPA